MNKKVFYFVNHTANFEVNTGVQRVTRYLGRALVELERDVVFVSWLGETSAATRSTDDELRRLARWNGPAFRSQGAKGHPLEFDVVDRDDLAGSWIIVPEYPFHSRRDADMTRDLIEYAHRVGLKIAFIFYDLIPIKMREYEALRDDHERYVRQIALADAIIPISCHSQLDLERYYRRTLQLPQANLSPIISCLLPEEIPSRRRVEVATEPVGNSIKIISVGTIEPRKNQTGLLEAFNGFCKKHPGLDVRLTLIGRHYLVSALDLEKLMPPNSRVEFVSGLHDEDIFALYDKCHFTVFPSLEEGYGLPIVESLWCGKPCLCANFGAMAEAAAGGGCLTVDTQSVEALGSGIERLSMDRSFRQKLAFEAVSRKMRSWQDYASAVLSTLDQSATKLGSRSY